MKALRRVKQGDQERFEVVKVPGKITCVVRKLATDSLVVQMAAKGRSTTAFTTWSPNHRRSDWWEEEKTYSIGEIAEYDPVVFFIPEEDKQDMEKQLRALLAAGCNMDHIRKFIDSSYIDYTDKDTLPPWEKQLTTEVFYMLECPDWAKYAAVDSEGFAFWYGSKPDCLEHTWGISASGWKPIPGLFDSTNWENSLIQRPGQVKEISVEDLEKIFGCTVKIKKADSL